MMLTSSGQHGEPSRCRELGISAYLTKPIQAADLHDAICRVLTHTVRSPRGSSGASAVGDGAASRRLRVLLAEDNVVNQRVAVGLLTQARPRRHRREQRAEALAALRGGGFDLVLMDVQMPEMGGFEATAAIRERERRPAGTSGSSR